MNDPENSYILREKIHRDGVYGLLVTVVTGCGTKDYKREETFTPIEVKEDKDEKALD